MFCCASTSDPAFFVFCTLVLGAGVSRRAVWRESLHRNAGPRLIYFGSDTSNSGSKICTVHTMPSYPLISIREARDVLAEPQLSSQLGKIQDTLSFHLYGTTKSRNGLFLQIPVFYRSPTFFFMFSPPHDHIPVLSL